MLLKDVKRMRINTKKAWPYEINFIVHTKAFEFENEGIQKVNADDIKSFLLEVKWKNRTFIEYCDAVDDIMSLQFSDVFDFLRAKVIVDARNKDLSDFNDLIFK